MDGPQTRLRPAGTGRAVDTALQTTPRLYGTGETAARAGYHGIAPPPAPPAPRNPAVIAHDLRSAAGCLAGLAGRFEEGDVNAVTLAGADRLLVGAGRLICELRTRGAA